ncbi:MAG: beta-lactamase family protein [Xanthomonadales bacterium]|nr:beta-lactamase family protein [Xanthomonadales bacterium]
MNRLRAALALLMVCCWSLSAALAQHPRGPAELQITPLPDPPAAPVERARDDPAGLSAYLHGLAEATLAQEQIAGLVIAVVRGNSILHLSGHGLAHLPDRPPDPWTSRFRVGSISKTVTYVALMRLIAQGRLQLDDPVNLHLPAVLQLPLESGAEPIRIRHLLSHTAGFEDSALGHLFVRDPARLLTPEQYLQRHRPAQVRPPGAEAVYSNYGITLLGAVIAERSGRSYIDQVEATLLRPLGMRHAGFREPLPEDHPAALSAVDADELVQGFRRIDGRFVPGEFEHLAHGAAAGGLSASAADLARWMSMLLGEGELDGVRVLDKAGARRLAMALHRNAPGVAAVGHGFLTGQYGPAPVYGHGGATLMFHSQMELLPQQGLGVFVSANSDNARAAVAKLSRLIVEHLHPELRPAPISAPAMVVDTRAWSGEYRSNRRNFSSAEKLFLSFGASVRLQGARDGSLTLIRAGAATHFLPVGEGVFRESDGHARLALLPARRFTTDPGLALFEPVGLWQSHGLLLLTLLAAAGLALARTGAAIWRWWQYDWLPRGLSAGRIAVALVWMSALSALGLALADALAQGTQLVYTYPGALFAGACRLLLFAALLTLVEFAWTIHRWRSLGNWRVRTVALAASSALLLTVAVLHEWRLVG